MSRTQVAILVPVLRRPQNVAPLMESIEAATTVPHRVLFIADPDDEEEQAAVREHGGELLVLGGSWAAKINAAVRATTEPLVFLAADDLRFRPGWLEAAQAHMRNGIEVVGVNDLIERRPGRENHATHFLMTRSYGERPCADGSPGPVFEGFDHSFCDDELIATAKHRGVYAYAEDSHVEHLHVMNDKAPDDDTYRRGRERFRQDRRLFLRRCHLWT